MLCVVWAKADHSAALHLLRVTTGVWLFMRGIMALSCGCAVGVAGSARTEVNIPSAGGGRWLSTGALCAGKRTPARVEIHFRLSYSAPGSFDVGNKWRGPQCHASPPKSQRHMRPICTASPPSRPAAAARARRRHPPSSPATSCACRTPPLVIYSCCIERHRHDQKRKVKSWWAGARWVGGG